MVLAAIGIPMLRDAQLRARFAEIVPNTAAVLDATMAYQMATDNDVPFGWNNPGLPGKQKQPWLTGTGFDAIGFAPDGEVYGMYFMSTQATNLQSWCEHAPFGEEPMGLATDPNHVLYARTMSNLDGDGDWQETHCCEAESGILFKAEIYDGRCGTYQPGWW